MNISLVKADRERRELLEDMINEWKEDIEKNHTNHSPWAVFKNSTDDFDFYLEHLDDKGDGEGKVPSSTFFCFDNDRKIFVGAVNIRHFLNGALLASGGHIGDGVRPSERRKGYATAMIGLALKECEKLGIRRVLMCCDKSNIGSAKSIIRNGGVLENEIREGQRIVQRYWIGGYCDR